MKQRMALFVIAAILFSGFVYAHGTGHRARTPIDPADAEQMPFGIAGDPKKISRTIVITMTDAMRFSPDTFEIKQGETIRFVVKNGGKLMHEMVIGTMDDLKKHAELMRKFPDMEHDESHMAHVSPGMSDELIWRFNRVGEFHFGCLIAGHFEAGMVGKIVVSDR